MRWWALLWLLLAVPAGAQDRVIEGDLTRADFESYREVPFDVPDGVRRVTVRLGYDKADRTVVDLGVWDGERFRGWSGGRRDLFTVSASDATPGYLPGALPAGRWRVVLGVPNIREGVRAHFRVEVTFDRGTSRAASVAVADAPSRTASSWYRGDLHMHDAHSDGSCASIVGKERVPCPLFRTVAAAQAAGLDFVAVSDHNTVAHFGALRELQPFFDGMLLIPAIEVTTFHGHANVFAPDRFIDFRRATQAGIGALQGDIAATGGIMSVNHPALPSGEACMGCGWTWRDTDWSRVAAVEVVNGANAVGPLAGTGFWYARLNERHRLTGVAGSDNHDPDAPAGQSPIGRPTTVVHAEGLSTGAIVRGIRDGNVFIDVDGTRDRLLEVTASQGRRAVAMGGTLDGLHDIAATAAIRHAAGSVAELMVDGRLIDHRAVVSDHDTVSFQLHRKQARRWFAVRVSKDGKPVLIGNPIYVDRPDLFRTWRVE